MLLKTWNLYCIRFKSAKYTLLTFLPLNIIEQFRRGANFYFLVRKPKHIQLQMKVKLQIKRKIQIQIKSKIQIQISISRWPWSSPGWLTLPSHPSPGSCLSSSSSSSPWSSRATRTTSGPWYSNFHDDPGRGNVSKRSIAFLVLPNYPWRDKVDVHSICFNYLVHLKPTISYFRSLAVIIRPACLSKVLFMGWCLFCKNLK